MREYQAQAKDPYALALVANALVAADLKAGGKTQPRHQDALDRLAGLAQRDGDKVFWKSGVATFMGCKGLTGSIETTALAALAFQRADAQPELANGALALPDQAERQLRHLAQHPGHRADAQGADPIGARRRREGQCQRHHHASTAGRPRPCRSRPQNFDVVQLLSFDDVNPGSENRVEIKTEGQGNLMYQVTASYYLPWASAAANTPTWCRRRTRSRIDVKYDRAQLAVNDTVKVTVTVNLNQKGARAESALIDLGLPPGFTVLSEDLDALVERYQSQAQDIRQGPPSSATT